MPFLRLVLITLTALVAFPLMAQPSGTIDQPSITVTGEAIVTEAVELIDLNARLSTRNEDSATAVRDLNQRVGRLVDAVEAAHTDNQKLVVDDFTVSPNYRHVDGERRIRNYEASQSVSIQGIAIADVEAWLSRVSDHSPDQLHLANGRAAAEDQSHAALAAAIDNARSKAKRIAEQSGGELGHTLSVVEESGSQPRPQPRALMASDGAEGSAPVFRPDDAEHRARVRVIFELITGGD